MKAITRNSSFELLRLILMLMIIIHHSIVFGMGLSGLGLQFDGQFPMHFNHAEQPVATILNCLCICAVNCFILISGYFGIKPSLKKFLTLVVCIILYTLFFNTIFLAAEGNYRRAVSSLMIFSHTYYWFVTYYLYLMIFAPALNHIFERFNRNYLYIIMGTMLFISCYLGFIWGESTNTSGYTFFQFILMYCIGRYIKKYGISFSRNKAIALYAIPAILTGLTMYLLWMSGKNELAWRMTYYNNPLIIISSIGLFTFFSTIKLNNNLINRLASSTFAIYLVQSSLLCSDVYYPFINNLQTTSGYWIWAIIIISSLVIIAFSILIDQIQKPINNLIVTYALKHLNKWK